jgi:hypothetical protein
VVIYTQQVQRLLQITTPPLVVITGRQTVLPNRPSLAPQSPPGCGAFYCQLVGHAPVTLRQIGCGELLDFQDDQAQRNPRMHLR